MASKIAFLGLGQAGSNICEVAERSNYLTGVINTSPEDLNALKLVKNKFLVGIEGGSGKDRRIAKTELKSYYTDIAEFVKSTYKDPEVELIYVTFSTGGGTGSGMGPLIIDVLRSLVPNKKFGAVAILPSATESTVAHANSYECIKELSSLSVPTILIDNDKCSSVNSQISRKKLYDTVNEAFIDDLDMILRVQRPASLYGNIDSKDVLKLLCTPGVTSLGILTEFSETMSLQKQMIRSLEESPYAPLEFDRVVSRIGVIYEVRETTTKLIQYDELNKDLGIPLELFEGIYLKPTDETVVTIVSGQSFPMGRINTIMETISKNKELFTTRKDFTIKSDSFDWFAEKREEVTFSSGIDKVDVEDSIDKIDISDIFSRY